MYKKATQYMKYLKCYRCNNIHNNFHDRVVDRLKKTAMFRQSGIGRTNRDYGKMRRKKRSKKLIKYSVELIIKHYDLKKVHTKYTPLCFFASGVKRRRGLETVQYATNYKVKGAAYCKA